jgi:lipoyl-dependent peroxiredoxin
MKRTGSAVWKGNLKDGKGTVSTESGVLQQTPYSFTSRFESGTGTNPEELIAAAHAGCFSMALANALGEAGYRPESIETTATLTLEKTAAGMAVTTIHLDVTGDVPSADAGRFDGLAEQAKKTCIISRLLNATITMEAKLRSGARA